jgi:hypothetical protein
MKSKIWYNKRRNEMQFTDKSIAIKAFKKGFDVYANRALNTSSKADDFKLTNVDDIIDIEQNVFFVKAVTIVEASAFIKYVNKPEIERVK